MGIIDEEILVSALSHQLGLKPTGDINRDELDFKKAHDRQTVQSGFFH